MVFFINFQKSKIKFIHLYKFYFIDSTDKNKKPDHIHLDLYLTIF